MLRLCYIHRDRHTVLGSAPIVDRGGRTHTLFATFQPWRRTRSSLWQEEETKVFVQNASFWFIACVDIVIFS